jgi:hypothetical protein
MTAIICVTDISEHQYMNIKSIKEVLVIVCPRQFITGSHHRCQKGRLEGSQQAATDWQLPLFLIGCWT